MLLWSTVSGDSMFVSLRGTQEFAKVAFGGFSRGHSRWLEKYPTSPDEADYRRGELLRGKGEIVFPED